MPETIKSHDELTTRAVSMGPSTFDEKTNSVKAIATTEKPARVFDYSQYDFVDEVLRVDGCVLPDSGRVPLLDSHSRYGVASVLGSAGEFSDSDVNGFKAKEATVVYSKTDEGASAAQKTMEGHLTDYSVGYQVLESFWVPEGQKQMIAGDEYEGPLKVVTKWKLKELSATPIGADEYAKARSENHNFKERKMAEKKEPETLKTKKPPVVDPEEGKKTVLGGITSEEATKVADDAVRAERERTQQIRSRCQAAGLDEATTNDFVDRGLKVDEASQEIFTILAKDNPPVGSGRTEIVADAQDKFRAAAVDGISLRAGLTVEKPAAGYEDFRGRGLLRIAEECLEVSGVNVRSLGKLELAAAAMGMGVRGIPSSSTSDFSMIMSNVANKRMLKSWESAAVTWDIFCNVVDAADFKPMQGIDISALPILDLIDENGEYNDVKMTEGGESYVVKTHGNMFKLNRHMIINDDLRVFLKIPSMFGGAAKRTINSAVFSLLNSSPVMADGSALFHVNHKNIVVANSGIPSVDSLSEGRKLMRQFMDPGGRQALNLTPKILVAGSKHETNTDVILTSAAIPEDSKSSGVINPFKAKMVPVIDSAQDAYDEDAWFLFPEKTASDALEVAFLDGVQTPYLEDMVDFDTDGIKFKCRIDFGVGVMSSRIVKNPGS